MSEQGPSALNVLLVEDEPADAEVVRRFLSLGLRSPSHRLRHVTSVGAAVETLGREAFDVVLLDQRLPDSDEDETLERVKGVANGVPIVVLTGHGNADEGARKVRMGAQDFLVKGTFDAHLLTRVIRHAVERSRLLRELDEAKLRERREDELRKLINLARIPDVGQPAREPLKASAPAWFEAMGVRYQELLDEAIEHGVFKLDRHDFSEKVQRFATELGAVRAGPRDVVELHGTALRARLQSAPEGKKQGYIEEARLLLPETMGFLIFYYRQNCPPPAPE